MNRSLSARKVTSSRLWSSKPRPPSRALSCPHAVWPPSAKNREQSCPNAGPMGPARAARGLPVTSKTSPLQLTRTGMSGFGPAPSNLRSTSSVIAGSAAQSSGLDRCPDPNPSGHLAPPPPLFSPLLSPLLSPPSPLFSTLTLPTLFAARPYPYGHPPDGAPGAGPTAGVAAGAEAIEADLADEEAACPKGHSPDDAPGAGPTAGVAVGAEAIEADLAEEEAVCPKGHPPDDAPGAGPTAGVAVGAEAIEADLTDEEAACPTGHCWGGSFFDSLCRAAMGTEVVVAHIEVM